MSPERVIGPLAGMGTEYSAWRFSAWRVLGIVFCRADTDERYEDGLMGKNTMTHQRPQSV